MELRNGAPHDFTENEGKTWFCAVGRAGRSANNSPGPGHRNGGGPDLSCHPCSISRLGVALPDPLVQRFGRSRMRLGYPMGRALQSLAYLGSGLGVTRFSQPPRKGVRFFTDHLRENGYWAGMDGRNQHLQGRVKESAT